LSYKVIIKPLFFHLLKMEWDWFYSAYKRVTHHEKKNYLKTLKFGCFIFACAKLIDYKILIHWENSFLQSLNKNRISFIPVCSFIWHYCYKWHSVMFKMKNFITNVNMFIDIVEFYIQSTFQSSVSVKIHKKLSKSFYQFFTLPPGLWTKISVFIKC